MRGPTTPGERIRLAWARWRRRPRAREKAGFYFRLATLLDAGIPVVQALESAEGGGRVADARSFLAAAARRGEPLSEAMPREPALFDPVEVALVRAGERAGRLGAQCRALAARFEAEQADAAEIRAGLAYPFAVLHFAVLVLPIPSLAGPGGFGAYAMEAFGTLAVLYGVAFAGFFAHAALSGDAAYGRLVGALPWIGALRRDRAHARFARTFAALHGSGLPFDQCVSLAGEASGLPERAADFEVAAYALKGGGSVASAIAALPWLSSPVLAAIAVGDRSGSLEETLGHAATDLERDAQARAQRLRKMLPVAIYLAIALWIAWRIVAAYVGVLSQIR